MNANLKCMKTILILVSQLTFLNFHASLGCFYCFFGNYIEETQTSSFQEFLNQIELKEVFFQSI
jgi:hypothetical protein